MEMNSRTLDQGSSSDHQSLKSQLQAPQLCLYTDFREYLRDVYQFRRIETAGDLRPYSYAHFSAAADIKSPNYLRLIIEGSRNLSSQMCRKFSRALGHSKELADEFELLVHYGQTKDPMERNRRLKALNDFRVKCQLKSGKIVPEAFEKVSSWVTWVLYAMVDQEGVKFTEEELLRLLGSKASPDEIRKSLKSLLDNGDLVRDEKGQLQKGRLLMAGAEGVSVAMVRKIQAELIYLGLESLHHDDSHDREIGAMTLALTEDEYEQMKFELRQLRKRWFKDLAVKREQAKGDRVFQLNFQLFPVSRNVKDL